jgi:hypothetical protein
VSASPYLGDDALRNRFISRRRRHERAVLVDGAGVVPEHLRLRRLAHGDDRAVDLVLLVEEDR